jgi:hypothetical protein
VDLAAGGAGDYARGLAVDVELEGVVADRDRNDLAGVDHADVDALGGDHDGAALGHAPLHDDWPRRGGRVCGSPGSAEPVPVVSGNRAWQCAKERAGVADDRHLRAVQPQRDALSGQVEADVDLAATEASKPDAVDSPFDLDSRSCPARQRRRPGWSGAVGCQPGEFDEGQPGRQCLEPCAISEDVQGCLIRPDGDRLSGQGGAEPDLLAADPQVP